MMSHLSSGAEHAYEFDEYFARLLKWYKTLATAGPYFVPQLAFKLAVGAHTT